eukprot:100179_1
MSSKLASITWPCCKEMSDTTNNILWLTVGFGFVTLLTGAIFMAVRLILLTIFGPCDLVNVMEQVMNTFAVEATPYSYEIDESRGGCCGCCGEEEVEFKCKCIVYPIWWLFGGIQCVVHFVLAIVCAVIVPLLPYATIHLQLIPMFMCPWRYKIS